MADVVDIQERFKGITDRAKRAARPVERKELTDDDRLRLRLGSWPSSQECSKVFLPWLENEMESANRAAHENISTHSVAAYALGYEAGLRMLLKRFKLWIDGG